MTMNHLLLCKIAKEKMQEQYKIQFADYIVNNVFLFCYKKYWGTTISDDMIVLMLYTLWNKCLTKKTNYFCYHIFQAVYQHVERRVTL